MCVCACVCVCVCVSVSAMLNVIHCLMVPCVQGGKAAKARAFCAGLSVCVSAISL